MSTALSTAYRLSVLSRIVAASVGGYVIINLMHLALSVVLPVEYFKVLLFSMQTGFLWWTCLVIWCFSTRSAKRAWLGLAVIALPFAVIDAWYYWHGGLP